MHQFMKWDFFISVAGMLEIGWDPTLNTFKPQISR
jgi:hypothetical protein